VFAASISEIRVAAANVGFERLADDALHALNLRGVESCLKFARTLPANEVFVTLPGLMLAANIG
jgi:hypothetical protein